MSEMNEMTTQELEELVDKIKISIKQERKFQMRRRVFKAFFDGLSLYPLTFDHQARKSQDEFRKEILKAIAIVDEENEKRKEN